MQLSFFHFSLLLRSQKLKLNIRQIRTFHERVIRCVVRLPGPALPQTYTETHKEVTDRQH